MKAAEVTNVSMCEIKYILHCIRQTYLKRNIHEVSTLLGCYATMVGSWVKGQAFEENCFTLENGTVRLSRNVGIQVPTHATKASATPRRKSKISEIFIV
jgi:hypothetical protein